MTTSTLTRSVGTLCAVLAAGALVTACSTTDGQGNLFDASASSGTVGSGSSSPTGFPTDTPSSGGSSTSLTPSGSSGNQTQDPALQAQLLTPSDVPGFTASSTTSSPDPLPCTPGEPPLFIANVPDQRADAQLVASDDQVNIGEVIAYYADASRADAAVAAAKRGFACSEAQLQGSSIRIVKVADTSGTTSAGSVVRISRWDYASQDGTQLGTAIIAASRGTVAALSFGATQQGKNEVNVQSVVKTALDKVQIR